MAITITTTISPDAMKATPYFFFPITSGDPAVSWSVVAGALPAGITLNTATGVLSGTPTTAGVYSFTVRATDAGAAFDEQAFTLEVINYAGLIFQATAKSVPGGDSAVVTGDTSGVRFLAVICSGWLTPLGLGDNRANLWRAFPEIIHPGNGTRIRIFFHENANVGPDHTIFMSGSAAAMVVLGFKDYLTLEQAAATPGAYQTGPLTPSTGRHLFLAADMADDADAAGVDSGFKVAASVPYESGANVGLNVAIKKQSPTPKTEAAYWFNPADLSPVVGHWVILQMFKVVTEIVTPAGALPNATRYVGYSTTIDAYGGDEPQTFSIGTGALPDGLAIDPVSGEISGVPVSPAGVYDFTVKYTDAAGVSDVKAYSITVVLYSGPARFPDPSITGIAWEHFNKLPIDYGEITLSHTYEDEGRSFNESTSTPPLRWECTFTGLSFFEMRVFEEFAQTVRLSVPFEFTDKWGVTHTGVRIETYERSHNANISWSNNVRFVLCKYP